jgi:hypothetical protein
MPPNFILWLAPSNKITVDFVSSVFYLTKEANPASEAFCGFTKNQNRVLALGCEYHRYKLLHLRKDITPILLTRICPQYTEYPQWRVLCTKQRKKSR